MFRHSPDHIHIHRMLKQNGTFPTDSLGKKTFFFGGGFGVNLFLRRNFFPEAAEANTRRPGRGRRSEHI